MTTPSRYGVPVFTAEALADEGMMDRGETHSLMMYGHEFHSVLQQQPLKKTASILVDGVVASSDLEP